MNRRIITTADGSKTIQIEEWNEQYHSVHGAIAEANHVFIKQGLLFYIMQINKAIITSQNTLNILEIGFGTGLNAILTHYHSKKTSPQLKINYTGIEAYPVDDTEIKRLNYTEQIEGSDSDVFLKMHNSEWEECIKIDDDFLLEKQKKFFEDIEDVNKHHLIYFDAFGARVQPQLWTESIFKKMYNALQKNGVLVTYSAKGSVRRAMQSVGFYVERLPGPPGKREMLRATKR